MDVYLAAGESSFEHGDVITCFMCGNKLVWKKMSCYMTSSCVEKELKDLPGGGNHYLNQWRRHFHENNHSYFYFSVTDVKMEEKETTKLCIQRALFNAVKFFV